MANKDFDTTILRALERPSASDLNQLQAQLYYTIRRLDRFRNGYDLTSDYSGFFGYSFFVQNLTGAGLTLNLSRGMGYQWAPGTTATNIDGIAGLNDLTSYKPLTMQNDKALSLAGQMPTTPGRCRRDLLEIKWIRELVDPTDLAIYDPTSQDFDSVNLNKTMTANFDDKNVVFVESGASIPSGAVLVYRKGVEVAYSSEASFETAPLPSVDSGFLPLAAINVASGDVNLPNSRIADLRRLLGNDRQFFISGTARIGVNYPSYTQHLTSVDINAPVGVRCAISRLNQYQLGNTTTPSTQNLYRLSILGPPVQNLNAVFTPYMPLSDGLPPQDLYPYPVNVSMKAQNSAALNVLDSSVANMLRSSDYSDPVIPAAVGQRYSSIDFALNAAIIVTAAPTASEIVLNYSSARLLSRSVGTPTVYDTIRQVNFMVMGEYAP